MKTAAQVLTAIDQRIGELDEVAKEQCYRCYDMEPTEIEKEDWYRARAKVTVLKAVQRLREDLASQIESNGRSARKAK